MLVDKSILRPNYPTAKLWRPLIVAPSPLYAVVQRIVVKARYLANLLTVTWIRANFGHFVRRLFCVMSMSRPASVGLLQ